MTESRIPVWLDCDPGHDDAFAMLIFAHHPSFNPLGISTTYGNSTLKNTTYNALSLLTAFSRLDIPVFGGAEHPTLPNRPLVTAASIHGGNGLSGSNLLPVPTCESQKHKSAVDGLGDAILACEKGTAYIIATGPLTNMYNALKHRPSIAEWVRGVSIMGGCIAGDFGISTFKDWLKVYSSRRSRIGSSNSLADPNFLNDPDAAHYVLAHPSLQGKITMCCLDMTHQVVIKPEIREGLLGKAIDDHRQSIRRMMIELLDHIIYSYAQVFGFEHAPLHDPVAVAVLLSEVELYDEKAGDTHEACEYAVDIVKNDDLVQTGEGWSQVGRTFIRKLRPGEKGVRIPKGLDARAFWQVLELCLSKAENFTRI